MSCLECGADVADFAACPSIFREFNARAHSEPVIGGIWWAIVDAYAMQHVEHYGKSAKSYAAHLMGLCCFVDHNAAPEVYRAIHMWMDGPARLVKPAILPPATRGVTTMLDVSREAAPTAQAAVARSWTASVWLAYASQHHLARSWLTQALGAPPRKK